MKTRTKNKEYWNCTLPIVPKGIFEEEKILKKSAELKDIVKQIFDLTAGPFDDPVISEELYNRMNQALKE